MTGSDFFNTTLSAEMRLSAPPSAVFPLLRPVREEEWIPGWKANVLHSRSGRAELGCVFTTRDEDGRERVWTYRRAGLSLATIAVVLGTPAALAEALRARFDDLDREIEGLREQQRVIASLLQAPELMSDVAPIDKATWVSSLRASGLSDEAMDRWHESFEGFDPQRHRRSLVALGIPAAEITRIRRKAARATKPPSELRRRLPRRRRSQSRGRPT